MRPHFRRLARLLFTLPFAIGITACGSGVSLDEPIEGPVWWVTRLDEQPVAHGNAPQRDAQIRFDPDSGRATGSGGCNRFSGTFLRNGNKLQISQLAATRTACADPSRSAEEAQFFAALQSTTGYRMEGSARMALMDAAGKTVAVLSTSAAQ